MSNFYEGQKVVCIDDKFPAIATTDADKSIIGSTPLKHPVKGETLVIDEMLGDEWLRFDKYDDNDSYNWWISTHFRPIDEIAIEASSSIEYVINESILNQQP